MPEVAESQAGISVLKVKTEMTIVLKSGHGHTVKGKFRTYVPCKLVLQSWRGSDGLPDKAYVVAYDITLVQRGGKAFPDSAKFNLVGTSSPPVPEWIARVIREFGYQDPIERIV